MADSLVPPPIVPGPGQDQSRTWNMLCHLSALAGLVFPFGNILGPLIIWQIKKNECPSVELHGKSAVNFQITIAIATIALTIAALILSFFCIGPLLFPVVALVYLAGLVFSVIAALKANDGVDYRYPYSIEIVK